jgi:hypothetical protein
LTTSSRSFNSKVAASDARAGVGHGAHGGSRNRPLDRSGPGEFILSSTCPPGFEKTGAGVCELRTIYQFYL